MLRVPIAAFGFFQAAKQWSSSHTTNGFIPDDALGPAIYASVSRRHAATYAKILSGAVDPARPDSKPLFERRDGGWQIHDYLDYNPSREDVLAGREQKRDRYAAGGRARAAAAARAGGKFTSDAPATHQRRTSDAGTSVTSSLDHGRTSDPPATTSPVPVPQPLTTQETSSPAPTSGAVRKPAGKKHAVQDPDVRDVVKHWAASWESRYEVTPEINWAKACGQLIGIVRRHGVEEAKALVDQLFLTHDRFILESRCDLDVFVRQINKLKIERRHGGNGSGLLSDKTSGNVDAAREAARLRGLAVISGEAGGV